MPGAPAGPRTPGFSPLRGEARSLISRQGHALRLAGINPEHVKVVTAWSSHVRFEGLAAVGGAIKGSLCDVDNVGVVRVYEHATEIWAADHTWIYSRLLPVRASVI